MFASIVIGLLVGIVFGVLLNIYARDFYSGDAGMYLAAILAFMVISIVYYLLGLITGIEVTTKYF